MFYLVEKPEDPFRVTVGSMFPTARGGVVAAWNHQCKGSVGIPFGATEHSAVVTLE